jgi:hypothetical protein
VTPLRAAWLLVAHPVALFFRLVPLRRRFRVMLALGRVAGAIFGPAVMRRNRRTPSSANHDEGIRLLMRALADGNTTYDVDLELDVRDPIEPRALFVSGHYPLNPLFIRWLYDGGLHPVGIKAFPEIDPCISGTRTPLDVLGQTHALLLKVKRRFDAGRSVVQYADGGKLPVEVDGYTYTVDAQILEFARRENIPTYFFCVRTQRGRLPLLLLQRIEPDPYVFAACCHEQRRALGAL